MARVTTTVVGAVSKGNGVDDFYPVLAWLRDTCYPTARPLHTMLNDHYDEGLKAAVVLHHDNWGEKSYELVLIHNHMLKRFSSQVCHMAPSWEEFTYIFGDGIR